jgi:hypothetical protein
VRRPGGPGGAGPRGSRRTCSDLFSGQLSGSDTGRSKGGTFDGLLLAHRVHVLFKSHENTCYPGKARGYNWCRVVHNDSGLARSIGKEPSGSVYD